MILCFFLNGCNMVTTDVTSLLYVAQYLLQNESFLLTFPDLVN